MRAGKLDRKITIQKPVSVQDEYGQVVNQFQDHVTIWAQIISINSSERFRESQHLAQADIVFRIRYRSDLNAKMQIVYNGDNYRIEGPPMELGRREGLDIAARAVGVE